MNCPAAGQWVSQKKLTVVFEKGVRCKSLLRKGGKEKKETEKQTLIRIPSHVIWVVMGKADNRH